MKHGLIKLIIAVLALCVPSDLATQSKTQAKAETKTETKTETETETETFTSPDGLFQFTYSKELVHCEPDIRSDEHHTSWIPPDSCMAMFPICDDEGIQGAVTIACFAYPRDEMKADLTFEGAAFFAGEVKGATTEKVCLARAPNWTLGLESKIVKINGTKFMDFSIAGGSGGSGIGGDLYRTLHAGKCYQLGRLYAGMTDRTMNDGNSLKIMEKQWDHMDGLFDQAQDSFKFLK
jgi:hypothetical protein